MNELEFYRDLVKEVNEDKDKYLKVFTVSNDIVNLKNSVQLLTRSTVVCGLKGRNSLCGPMTSVNFDNVTKVVLCNAVK